MERRFTSPVMGRYALVFAAWLIAYLIVIPGHGAAIIGSAPAFPLGLLRLLHLQDASGMFLCLGWGVYAFLTAGAVRLPRPAVWLLTYVVLVVLLVINAAGCRMMIDEAPSGKYSL